MTQNVSQNTTALRHTDSLSFDSFILYVDTDIENKNKNKSCNQWEVLGQHNIIKSETCPSMLVAPPPPPQKKTVM